MQDFTLKILTELYNNLQKNNYKIITLSDFLKRDNSNKVCILRHDVDRWIKNALVLAGIEHRLGISASYYFRYRKTFDKNIINTIKSFGHEIGYHYEVLTKAKGNYDKAIKLFKRELVEFNKTSSVNTICAHGAPFSRWDNKKLWDKYNFIDFGITGEAYLSVDFNKVLYLSDTGRSWNCRAANIRDRVETKLNYTFENTHELISAITNNTLPDKIMLNIHPNRWNDNLFLWSIELIGQNVKNLLKQRFIRK